MPETDVAPEIKIEPPTEPGFYKYSGGNQNMVFLLLDDQWYTWFSNNIMGPCEWGYIEQALSVWDLVKI